MHLGDGTSLRCHEGTLRIGDKTVFGRNIVVNAYLDVEIGGSCIFADMVYVTDFDHVFGDVTVPIKDQGIAKSPVRIGSDVWLGTKVTVVRGTVIGNGVVVAAQRGGDPGPARLRGRGRRAGPGDPQPAGRGGGQRRRPARRWPTWPSSWPAAGRHLPA